MKNSNLISTVIYAQVLLIFISFKIPDSLTKKQSESAINNNTTVTKHLATVSEKSSIGEKNGVTFNFNYPSVEDKNNIEHTVFNTYVLNKTESAKFTIGFGEATSSSCKIAVNNSAITNQYSDFKLYNNNDSLVSVLLLKADYLNNQTYPQYSFYTLNYSLIDGQLLGFDDVFSSNSKEKFVSLLNSRINKLGNCSAIDLDTFNKYKNNFVINDSVVKFYFDECMMCEDHHREYAVEIPLAKLSKSMIITDII